MAKNNEGRIHISPAQLREIEKTAAAVAVEKYQELLDRERQERSDKRLHNTKLLLERYRGLKRYCDKAVYDASQIDNDDMVAELVQQLGWCDKPRISVESIQVRATQVGIILSHVDNMLDFYKLKCESSDKDEISRRWQTVEALYLIEDEKSIGELASEMYVDERTVYRYQKAAFEELSALFFGVIIE